MLHFYMWTKTSWIFLGGADGCHTTTIPPKQIWTNNQRLQSSLRMLHHPSLPAAEANLWLQTLQRAKLNCNTLSDSDHEVLGQQTYPNSLLFWISASCGQCLPYCHHRHLHLVGFSHVLMIYDVRPKLKSLFWDMANLECRLVEACKALPRIGNFFISNMWGPMWPKSFPASPTHSQRWRYWRPRVRCRNAPGHAIAWHQPCHVTSHSSKMKRTWNYLLRIWQMSMFAAIVVGFC